MPRMLAEYKRAVERIRDQLKRNKISKAEAARLIERARLKYEAHAMRFEQIGA